MIKNFRLFSYNYEKIEEDLGIPVLGVIPWLDREIYDEPDIMFAIDEAASFYSLAYQKTVSCLKLRGNSLKKRVFGFTSSEFSKFRSTIIMNTAYSLSRTGQSVIVVDADFRTPSIGADLGLNPANHRDLAGLITAMSREIRENELFMHEKIDQCTYSIPNISNFFIIPNSGSSPDPSLYLHSSAFRRLLQELKSRYDWVFIDIPPISAVPDALMVGSCVDGIVLMTGLDVDRMLLRKICQQFKTYNIEVFGVITREIQANRAVSANTYIKQIMARMLMKNEHLIPS